MFGPPAQGAFIGNTEPLGRDCHDKVAMVADARACAERCVTFRDGQTGTRCNAFTFRARSANVGVDTWQCKLYHVDLKCHKPQVRTREQRLVDAYMILPELQCRVNTTTCTTGFISRNGTCVEGSAAVPTPTCSSGGSLAAFGAAQVGHAEGHYLTLCGTLAVAADVEGCAQLCDLFRDLTMPRRRCAGFSFHAQGGASSGEQRPYAVKEWVKEHGSASGSVLRKCNLHDSVATDDSDRVASETPQDRQWVTHVKLATGGCRSPGDPRTATNPMITTTGTPQVKVESVPLPHPGWPNCDGTPDHAHCAAAKCGADEITLPAVCTRSDNNCEHSNFDGERARL